MATQLARRWAVRYSFAVLCLTAIGNVAFAGDLDSLYDYRERVQDFLGEKDYTNYDSLEIDQAINAGLRAVAEHVGFIGYQTITITADTYLYTLNSDFMAEVNPNRPPRAITLSADGTSIIELRLNDLLDLTQEGASTGSASGSIRTFRITGGRFWISPAAPPGSKIYVHQALTALTMGPTRSDTTNVPNELRGLAVDYAVYKLYKTRQNLTAAAQWWGDYAAAVAAHGGNVPQVGGQ